MWVPVLSRPVGLGSKIGPELVMVEEGTQQSGLLSPGSAVLDDLDERLTGIIERAGGQGRIVARSVLDAVGLR